MECTLNFMLAHGWEREVEKILQVGEHVVGESPKAGKYIVITE